MSVFRDAQVQITLADYANTDAAGKLNVIGGGVNLVGFDPNIGVSAPITLMVHVIIPAKHADTTYALTIELHDTTTGQIVGLPGPGAQLQPLRAQQAVTVPHLQVPPGFARPEDGSVSTTLVMGFANGLPLAQGHSFEWLVQIDGQTRNWVYRFHVLAPAAGMVFGGPMGSPVIPGIGQYVVNAPEEPGEPGGAESAQDPDPSQT